MFIPLTPVDDDKLSKLMEITSKPQGGYCGYERGFITSDGDEYWVDTRYDGELIAAGLINGGAS